MAESSAAVRDVFRVRENAPLFRHPRPLTRPAFHLPQQRSR
ncbi:MAG TPA: hypothetical protein VED01_28125 [Burkholderiales bacterium]|nr:hypothetical protein [Burkholderiales bacterium]